MRAPIRLAIRHLRTSWPGALFVALTLSLSIGSVGATYGLVDAILLRSLAVPNPEQIVTVAPMIGEAVLGIPAPTLIRLAESQQSLQGLCGFSRGAMAIQQGSTISRKGQEAVSGSCYALLGVQPHLGRLIDERDAPLSGASAAVVVVTHSYWASALGSDASVVGRPLRVENADLTIIGVLPPTFMGFHADQGPDIVVPIGLVSPLLGNASRTTALYAIGRLRDGVSVETARAELRSLWTSVWADSNPLPQGSAGRPSPASDPATLRVESASGGLSDLRRTYSVAVVILGALALILVIMASVNVAGLLAAQAAARASEVKVLAALGAGRTEVVMQLATEALLTAMAAGSGAVLVAIVLTRLVGTTLWVGFLPMTMQVQPDPSVLAGVLFGSALLSLLLTVPSMAILSRHTGGGLATNLRSTAPRSIWRHGLVGLQAAFTLALVFCAALFAGNLRALNRVDPGYDASPLDFSRLERVPDAPREWDPPAYVRTLQSAVMDLPGVESAALSSSFPTSELRTLSVLLPVTNSGTTKSASVGQYRVSPGFFDTIGASVLRGRDFSFDDATGRPPVAIVNHRLAGELFPDDDPIGQVILMGPTKRVATVVGVVPAFSPGDVRITDLPIVYTPFLQEPQFLTNPMLVVRRAPPTPAVDAVRVAVRSGGRHYVNAYRSVPDHLAAMIARERILFVLSAFFAALGIAVGGAGLFAVLTYSVVQRTKEIGIRMAVGARTSRVVSLVVRDALLATLAGVLVGIPLALGGGYLSRALLYRMSPSDPVLLMICIAVIATAAAIAAAVPAFRAVTVDPLRVLKSD